MKKSKYKLSQIFLGAAVASLALFALARGYFRLTDDFRLTNITYDMPHHQEWDIPSLVKEERGRLESILDQKFYYIGKGAQSYAFGSQDGKYVLKFFKFKHLRPNWFVDLLPRISPFKQYKETLSIRKQRKLYGVFEGYRLAYEVHKLESGLVFIHLNKTAKLYPAARLIDKIGFERKVYLDQVPFVVQEKAKTTRSLINESLKNGDILSAQKRIEQIFDLYLSEYQKGIYDKDHGVMHNTGFVGERPIHLDVGKLTADNEMKNTENWQQDLERIAWKFAVWTKETYPLHYPVIAKSIEDNLSHLFGRSFEFSKSTPPPRKKR